MTMIDVMGLADVLRAAAKAEILPRFRRLEPGTVKTKSNPTDLVTEADTEAEHFIKREVARRWPGTLVVGEESVAADPALLDKLAGADVAITVDPVDGTANFAAGLPLFAVMASIVVRGETVAGIIYDPMGDDWVMAERGGGAWLRRPAESPPKARRRHPVRRAICLPRSPPKSEGYLTNTLRTPRPSAKASRCARPCAPAPRMSRGPSVFGARRWAATSDTAAVRRAVTVGPSSTSSRSPVATSKITTSP